MEKLKNTYDSLNKALITLDSANKFYKKTSENDEVYVHIRNSVIKSFEYTMDSFWKFLKLYLEMKYNEEELNSPRSIFKKCLDIKIINNIEFDNCAKLLEDRNITSHTYNEILAEEICESAPAHYQTMKTIVGR